MGPTCRRERRGKWGRRDERESSDLDPTVPDGGRRGRRSGLAREDGPGELGRRRGNRSGPGRKRPERKKGKRNRFLIKIIQEIEKAF